MSNSKDSLREELSFNCYLQNENNWLIIDGGVGPKNIDTLIEYLTIVREEWIQKDLEEMWKEEVNMATELKPCPFCGTDENMLSLRTIVHGAQAPGCVHYTMHDVHCNECYVTTGEYPGIENAIAAWNRRTEDGNE